MRATLHLAAALLCLAGTAQAQRAADLAPAEPVPADYAGTEWRDSRGCLFVRATVAGSVRWLPLLDAERQLVCAEPGLAEVPAAPEGDPGVAEAQAAPESELSVAEVPAAPEAEPPQTAADPEVPPQIAEAGEVLARVARIATGQGNRPPADEIPPPRPPAIAAAPEPEADPFAALGRMAEDTAGPTGRLIFVPPDDRVRIVHVEMPSVLVGGGDPFGAEQPRQATLRHTAHAIGQVGYHPPPGRLQVAPPIHGFGPDPAPMPRLRRMPVPVTDVVALDGSDPSPLMPRWVQAPGG